MVVGRTNTFRLPQQLAASDDRRSKACGLRGNEVERRQRSGIDQGVQATLETANELSLKVGST